MADQNKSATNWLDHWLVAGGPLIIIVAYTVLTTLRIDDEEIVLGTAVLNLSIAGASIPLPLGTVALEVIDLPISLASWIVGTPLLLLAIQVLAALQVRRRDRGASPQPFDVLLVLAPAVGLLVTAREFFPFLAARPEGAVLEGLSSYWQTPSTLHAFCTASAATLLLWLTGPTPIWRGWVLTGALLAVAVALALQGTIEDFLTAFTQSFGLNALLEAIWPVRILLAALALVWLPAAILLLYGPFGFSPWVPPVLRFRNRLLVADHSTTWGQNMNARLAATLVLGIGIAGFAEARPLDLTNRTLVHGAPESAPDPAMVIAYALEAAQELVPPEDAAQHAWRKAEEFAWRNVSGVDFSDYRLPGTDLSGSLLHGAIFSRAALRAAKLDNTKSSGSRFDLACLRDGSFQNALLGGVRLGTADFVSSGRPCPPVILAREDLLQTAQAEEDQRTDFSRALMHLADFGSGGNWNEETEQCDRITRFPNIILDEAKLHFSTLDCFEFQVDSNLGSNEYVSIKSSFLGASLRGAIFKGLTVENRPSSFARADLRGASFSGASPKSLRNMGFQGADLRNVDLSLVDAMGADFTCANLEGAQLNDTINLSADLEHAIFSSKQTMTMRELPSVPPSPTPVSLSSSCLRDEEPEKVIGIITGEILWTQIGISNECDKVRLQGFVDSPPDGVTKIGDIGAALDTIVNSKLFHEVCE